MEGIFRTLIWLSLSGFMLLVVDVASYSLKRIGWRRFTSTFLFFTSQVIASEFLLGALSILTGTCLIIVNLLLSSIMLFILLKRPGSSLLSRYFASMKKLFRDQWKELRQDPLYAAIAVLAVGFLLWILFLGIIFPATDFDGNSYHLTFVGYVIQNHNFFDPVTSLKWLAGYPKGGEFIQMWTMLIPKSDMFADLAQLPFLCLAVFSLYEIGKRLDVSKRNARFAAVLFVFLPIVLNQMKTTYVDVMLCSLFFASLAMVIQKKLNKLDLLLLGILISLIISIKSTGLLFVVAIVPLLIWNLYENRSKGSFKKTAWPSYIKPLLVIAIPTAFGLYWYIKNWIVYGSPIYPFGFKLLGHHVFPGPTFQEFAANAVNSLPGFPKSCVSRIWFVWTEQKDWFGCMYNYDTNFAGLGPIWFVLLIPSALAAGFFALRERRLKLIAVAITIIGLFAIYPTNYYSRYTMFITALGILALGFVLDRLTSVYGTIVKSLAIILAASVILTNFALCNFPPATVRSQLKFFSQNLSRGPIYRNTPGEAFVFLESRLKSGDLVVYDSSPYFIYPLWRPDFSNKVEYIKSGNETDWTRKVRAARARYVFTTTYSREYPWAEKNLKKIYGDQMYGIYQVN